MVDVKVVRMRDKWEIIESISISCGVLIGIFLLSVGVVNRDIYSLIGSYLCYLYLVKD